MGGLPVILGLTGWDRHHTLKGRLFSEYHTLAFQFLRILMLEAYILARAYFGRRVLHQRLSPLGWRL